MTYITVDSLPSCFKPYPFKAFKMKSITVDQAMRLGSHPSLQDTKAMLKELIDEIDVDLLVPVDLKFLVARQAFNCYPSQTWNLKITCPYCSKVHVRKVQASDFPPIPSFEKGDDYPLTIDDGTHIYKLGYATLDKLEKVVEGDPMSKIEAHVLEIDGSTEGIHDKLYQLTDFGLTSIMYKAVEKYFGDESYAPMECPECKKSFAVPLSALEVTQYTPFCDTEKAGKYKTNFRL